MSLTPSLIVAFGSFTAVPATLLLLAVGLEMLNWSRHSVQLVRDEAPLPREDKADEG